MEKSENGPPVPSGLENGGSATAMTQDIAILLLPYISSADARVLYQLCLSSKVLTNKDNGVQKRGYKTLAKLVETGKVNENPEVVFSKLDEQLDGLAPAAKKVMS